MKIFKELISDSEFEDEFLLLEVKDFRLNEEYIEDKQKGFRFSHCLIPKQFEYSYEDYPVFNRIRGNLYVGGIQKANIIFYD